MYYSLGLPPGLTPPSQPNQSSGGSWTDFFKDLIGDTAKRYLPGNQQLTAEERAAILAAQKERSSTTSWLPWVLVGAGAGLAVLLVVKRK